MEHEMSDQGSTLETIDIQRLMQLLPHRYPFLLVDRIVEARGDEFGVGIKNVTINEPQFTGHFPDRPVFPGVLLIEAMAQTAGVIGLHARNAADRPKKVFFVSIDKAKFRKPVVPGDRVELHMTKIARKRDIYWYEGRAMVDGALVCEAQVSAILNLEG
jgi:3-hydroxyacyl-[acyl-carrier-protein] dehydratase